MKKVTILGLYNSMATTIFGPMDILNQAGRLWNRVTKAPATPFFEVSIASADGLPIQSTNNVLIQPHCSIDQVGHTDILVIASATCIEKILEKSPGLVPWIRRQYDQGAHIASICTGVFLLAETGLLDGKSATLHWGFTKKFSRRYPRVTLRQDQMYIDHGRIYCSAGVSAGMDLSLYLVKKFCGPKAGVASAKTMILDMAGVASAKTMILDMGRTAQTPYDHYLVPRDHGDPLVIKAQEWIEQHQSETIDYEWLARKYRMSRRSLERRFKRAVAVTPLGYLQRLRVEYAKQRLEEGRLTFAEITYQAGYEDISFFRKLFVRTTGLRPRDYQQRFTGPLIKKSRNDPGG